LRTLMCDSADACCESLARSPTSIPSSCGIGSTTRSRRSFPDGYYKKSFIYPTISLRSRSLSSFLISEHIPMADGCGNCLWVNGCSWARSVLCCYFLFLLSLGYIKPTKSIRYPLHIGALESAVVILSWMCACRWRGADIMCYTYLFFTCFS